MCDLRYFKRAYHKYDYAVRTMQFFKDDEEYIYDIAYNLQQCVEMVLKAFLDFQGVTVPKTHSIPDLIMMAQSNTSLIIITDWLNLHSYELRVWEEDTRYNFNFKVQIEKIKEAIREIKIFLTLNGLSFILEDEITEKVKKELLEFMPKTIEIHDDFEWNIYYHVFKRKLEFKRNKEQKKKLQSQIEEPKTKMDAMDAFKQS